MQGNSVHVGKGFIDLGIISANKAPTALWQDERVDRLIYFNMLKVGGSKKLCWTFPMLI